MSILIIHNNLNSSPNMQDIDDFGLISLMYHRFEENKYPSTNIRIDDFEKHIKILKENNIRFINPKNFENEIKNNKKQRKILLTIDDGFSSFYQNAWPLLKKEKIPFILFVSTREVGAFNYMTWDQIREISKEDFVEIGNHSHSHEYLIDESNDVIKNDIKKSIESSTLKSRGILPGDVVLIYTGWSDNYQDPDELKLYYSMAPGISYSLAEYLASKKVVAVGLDTPFVDALSDPKNPIPAPEGTPENMAFPVHHYFLTQAGVHTLENFNLKKLSDDAVDVSCVMILPLMVKGSSASSIRPVAIGPSTL